ncbi:hypothetical protein D3C80_2068760 [compost metagenome]
MKRSEYAIVSAPAMVAAAGMTQLNSPSRPCASVSPKNISLLRKPLNSGTPAIDSDATIASTAVCGM